VQMIMTRPCRRMTRHLLQIFLTLGLTFTVLPYFPVRAGTPGRVTAHPSSSVEYQCV
jgi:hypothetical protein